MRDTHLKQCGHEKSEQIIDKYFERNIFVAFELWELRLRIYKMGLQMHSLPDPGPTRGQKSSQGNLIYVHI